MSQSSSEEASLELMMRTLGCQTKSRRCKSSPTLIQVLLGLQDLYVFKLMPRSHTNSDFYIIYMYGKLTTRDFQRHWSRLQIHPESSEIAKTRQSEFCFWCCVTVLVHWVVYRVRVCLGHVFRVLHDPNTFKYQPPPGNSSGFAQILL